MKSFTLFCPGQLDLPPRGCQAGDRTASRTASGAASRAASEAASGTGGGATSDHQLRQRGLQLRPEVECPGEVQL